MSSKTTKIIAIVLVLMLMMSYFSIIGEVIGTSIESQTAKTSQTNVEFDAYFDAENQKVHSASKNIGEENYLNLELDVKEEGYLKDIVVELEDANFNVLETENEQIAKIEENKIYLNQINNGNTAKVQLPIGRDEKESILPSDLSKESKVRLVATYMNGDAKEKKIEKEVTLNLTWTASNLDAEFSMQIAKFIPYEIKEEKGIVLQTLVQSKIKDNSMPVKTNRIEIEIPKINNIEPEEVKVSANSLNATNGDKAGANFSEANYKIENGKLVITVENKENKEGKISWKKDAIDEFTITYVYNEKALNSIGENGIELKAIAKNEITAYDAQATKVEKELEGEITLKDQISNLVDFYITSNKETISKGQIYANYSAENKIETEIEETITANIGLAEFTDKIIVEAKQDSFVNNEEEKSLLDASYIKEVKLNKEEIEKILGEDLEIKIYANETEIATINKESKEEDYKINTAELNINTLKIETNKPVAEGKINIEIVRAIKGETEYSKSQIASFNKFEMSITGKAENENETFVEQNVVKEIALTDPKSEAELKIENSNLSTVVENKDVKLTAILKTDTLDCMLYKNPTIEITLPSYIENVNIKNVETLFDKAGSELKIRSTELRQNEDGTKTISIILEGNQTEYSLNAVAKGLNIVITTDLTLNKLTPNREDEITMVYTNANVVTPSNGMVRAAAVNTETKTITAKIQAVAPVGVIAISKVENYKEDAAAVEVMTGEQTKTATIETLAAEKTANFNNSIINNYNNTIDNIVILGRTMFKANKDILSNADLGTTFDAPMQSAITVTGVDASKVTIYYSENAEATKDVSLAANGWVTEPADYSKIKSYLIVLAADYSMNTADRIEFNYSAQIPANLQHNEYAYENYVAYFNNNLATGTVQDKEQAPILGITTGRGPVLEASISSDKKETEEVQTDEIITYTITVKNTGTETAENVKAEIAMPTGLKYVEKEEGSAIYKKVATTNGKAEVEIGNVEAGKTVTKKVTMQVDAIPAGEGNLTSELKASVLAANLSGKIETNTVKNSLVRTYYAANVQVESEYEVLKENEEFTYFITVVSSSPSVANENTVVEMTLPKEIEYKDIEIKNRKVAEETDITNQVEKNYDSASRKLTINLGKVDGLNIKEISVKAKTSTLENGTYSKEAKAQLTVEGTDARKQTVQVPTVEIGKIGVKISQTSNIPSGTHIAAYEDFTYTFTVENLSGLDLTDVKIKENIPEAINFENATVTYGDGTTRTYYKNEITLNIKGNEKLTIKVNATAKAIEDAAEASNKAVVEYEKNAIAESNAIKHIVDKADGITENDSSSQDGGETIRETKRIMGTVWEDANADGKRDENEKTVEGIEMLLFNNETGTLVTDNAGNTLRLRTDDKGAYTFAGIAQGKYTVIFLYDSTNYSATVYRKAEVDETLNSDGVDTTITLDGVTRVAAITEEIVISESNVYGIDLGLISNPKFDLKLDKYVSKITVQNSAGTTVNEYKDAKIAKKELVAKQIPNTTIIVEYKIKVTNEGAVAGYVKKIADYMPSEMKFSSELNKDWYTSDNGKTLYNASLANTLIQPGETKEVTLTLTKKMTNDNLGLYNNQAEIFESYNDLGIEDMDSKAGNKASTEDDISSADVLISVKTGQVELFIGLSVGIIAAVAGAAYVIKKKVIR